MTQYFIGEMHRCDLTGLLDAIPGDRLRDEWQLERYIKAALLGLA